MAFPSVCAAAGVSPRLLDRGASARGTYIFVRIFAHCTMAPPSFKCATCPLTRSSIIISFENEKLEFCSLFLRLNSDSFTYQVV
uniref:Secreted protein n=1 Tax=Trichogramma kaykai TaxID=54128 RepID=A0ABD2WSD1_9HYME